MQHGPGRGRDSGETNTGRGDTVRVHVTECDVTVLLIQKQRIHAVRGWNSQELWCVLWSNAHQEAGVPGHVATVETVPWNLIRLIPA